MNGKNTGISEKDEFRDHNSQSDGNHDRKDESAHEAAHDENLSFHALDHELNHKQGRASGCDHAHDRTGVHEEHHFGHEHHHERERNCSHEHYIGHDHEHGCCHEHQHDGLSCGCGHCHHEHEKEEQPNVMVGRLITSGVLLLLGLIFPGSSFLRFLFSLLSALSIGYDVILNAVKNFIHRELLDETFLMFIASVGAFVLGEFTEGAMVLLLFQLGEFLQDLAVERSRKSISSLMNLRPDHAVVLRNGMEITVAPEKINRGEIILVRPGERIPLDGTVIEGESFLDTVALTGESVPRSIRKGEEALSGCVNLRGILKIRVERLAKDSAVSRILELVENATEHKSHADKFITRFARVYTPIVVGAAILMLVLGGVISGSWSEWLRRSLTFLVISCPCALVISVPLSYFSGIGRASKQGILVKGSNILEWLSRTAVVAFDKTGTVTKGVFQVVAIHPNEMKEDDLIRYAAGAEKYSVHPIADAVRESCPEWERMEVTDSQEIAGMGVISKVNGHRVAAGNERLMKAEKVDCRDCHLTGTIVHIAVDGKYEGHLVIADVVKESAAEAVRQLKNCGIREVVMLTGDRAGSAQEIGRVTGVDSVYAELKPEDKVSHIYRLMARKKKMNEAVVFVGDGINDAPVLAAADLGVAMGSAGADAAVEAADVVLIDDDPMKLVTGIKLARRTQAIVKQNIIFSIAVKVVIMILGAFGIVPLWLAVFSDVGVCLLAILNAIR